MTTTKKLGIWMDHSTAHIMELDNNAIESKTIESAIAHEDRENGSVQSENLLHNKEKRERLNYYKKLGDVIKLYEQVLLFGPTTAKNELANVLKSDHYFDKINVVVKHADKMSYNQQQAFVREHFYQAVV